MKLRRKKKAEALDSLIHVLDRSSVRLSSVNMNHSVRHTYDKPVSAQIELRDDFGRPYMLPPMSLHPSQGESFNANPFPLAWLTQRDEDAAKQVQLRLLITWDRP